jgi:hypothetical protein
MTEIAGILNKRGFALDGSNSGLAVGSGTSSAAVGDVMFGFKKESGRAVSGLARGALTQFWWCHA